jgi:hypothetical protein
MALWLLLQDDWKVTPKLTLNLGLRWDIPGQPHEINGATRTLRFDLDPKGPVLWPDPGKVADFYLGEYRDFSPRVGFAYRMPHRSVVRGGYGIFYSIAQFDNMNILQLNPPGAGSLTVINPSTNPPATIQNPVPAEIYPTTPIFNAISVPPDRRRRNAYMQNFNLQVSHELTNNDALGAPGGWAAKAHMSIPARTTSISWSPARCTFSRGGLRQGYARIRMIAPTPMAIYHSQHPL